MFNRRALTTGTGCQDFAQFEKDVGHRHPQVTKYLLLLDWLIAFRNVYFMI
jgi:hypothetical protein